MTKIPENFVEFLYWVKEITESFWSIDPKTSTNDFVCEDWIYGAKWIGLSESEIDNVEIKYSIKFTLEHRAFLKILHTIDRKEKIEYTESFEEDAEILIDEVPFFYNWLKDEAEIIERLHWPFKTIYEDVIGHNRVWLKSWGKRPNTELEIKKIYTDWYEKNPSLIPLTSHRFLVSDNNLKYKPVLSIYGSDIIIYGWNLRSYLLNELQNHLNIQNLVYDDEDDSYYRELIDEVKTIFENEVAFDENKIIPNLQEMILIWNSGWSSFGLEYPSEDKYSIFKTYVSEDEPNEQKKFNEF
uniref:hypothetical protein n=1 Tax=Flavobacterium sp. TaxID=239 RepID=UPI004049977F